MIIYTTLKQQDLDAVSVQSLFSRFMPDHAPVRLQRFDQYDIKGAFDDTVMHEVIRTSHVFYNPNKHRLITASDQFSASGIYVRVSRKSPLNLADKATRLVQFAPNMLVDTVTHAELWLFQFSTTPSPDSILRTFVMSSPQNHAVLAHPLIHHAQVLTRDDIHCV